MPQLRNATMMMPDTKHKKKEAIKHIHIKNKLQKKCSKILIYIIKKEKRKKKRKKKERKFHKKKKKL